MKILVLCTGNSARSIIGEVLLRDRSHGRIIAYSAGSQPKSVPHPAALMVLTAHGHDVAGLASKSWDMFTGDAAPRIDVAITVCDNALGEICPIFPGAPIKAHWGIADPAAVTGPGQEAAFAQTYTELRNRVDALLELPFETMPPVELRDALHAIGRMHGATHG
jgi:protein-tyrosine-phosphatase